MGAVPGSLTTKSPRHKPAEGVSASLILGSYSQGQQLAECGCRLLVTLCSPKLILLLSISGFLADTRSEVMAAQAAVAGMERERGSGGWFDVVSSDASKRRAAQPGGRGSDLL